MWLELDSFFCEMLVWFVRHVKATFQCCDSNKGESPLELIPGRQLSPEWQRSTFRFCSHTKVPEDEVSLRPQTAASSAVASALSETCKHSSHSHFAMFSGSTFPRSCSVAVDQTHSASLPAQLRFQMSVSNPEQRQTTRMDSSPLHFINRLNILESSAALFLKEKRQTLNQERVTFSCLFQSCFTTVNPHTHTRVYEWNYSSSTPCQHLFCVILSSLTSGVIKTGW